MKFKIIISTIAISALSACANVDVTKTSQGYFSATDPNTIDVLKTRPEKVYTELGTITVSGFSASETAKMHNAIREKAAPLGANAVILTEEGLISRTFGMDRWATGVAIRFK